MLFPQPVGPPFVRNVNESNTFLEKEYRESNHLTAAAMKDFGLFFFRFQFERNISVCIWQEMPSSGG